jgi:iron uptake system EfeUOB component EfeO/EfeM
MLGVLNGIVSMDHALVTATKSTMDKALSALQQNTTQVQMQVANSAGVAVGAQDGQDVMTSFRRRVLQQQAFAQQIADLRKAGLNSTSLAELIQAGASSGGATAAALLSGGKASIGQTNALEGQLMQAGLSLGQTDSAAKGLDTAYTSAHAAFVKAVAAFTEAVKVDAYEKAHRRLPAGVTVRGGQIHTAKPAVHHTHLTVELDGRVIHRSTVKQAGKYKARNGNTRLT